MPTLKQLTCTIEREPTWALMNEYNTTYGDGFVETYIAVPKQRTGFAVHLKSSGFIAPGLIMFVFIDGVYQCNRNRHNLMAPDGIRPSEFHEVDFRVFQKEREIGEDQFIGRAWSFDSLNVDKDINVGDATLDNLGTIEVVVLRARPYSVEPASTKTAGLVPAQSASAKHPKNASPKTGTGKAAKKKELRVVWATDGAADDLVAQNFGAGFDGSNDGNYGGQNDRVGRQRHDYDSGDSQSPPPFHELGPSYGDYLIWRDLHPDAAVPGRGQTAQRIGSYYDQYRRDSGGPSQNRGQRINAHASDGIISSISYEYWVFEEANLHEGDRLPAPVINPDPSARSDFPLSGSQMARRPHMNAISSDRIPQSRPSRPVSNRHVHWSDGYPSQREEQVTDQREQAPNPFSVAGHGQPEGSLARSSRLPDPMYNPRYPPEPPLPSQNDGDDSSKMPGGWDDPKDCAMDAYPTTFATYDINDQQAAGPASQFPEFENPSINFEPSDDHHWAVDGQGTESAQDDGGTFADSNVWPEAGAQEIEDQANDGASGHAQQDTGSGGDWDGNAGDGTGNNTAENTGGQAETAQNGTVQQITADDQQAFGRNDNSNVQPTATFDWDNVAPTTSVPAQQGESVAAGANSKASSSKAAATTSHTSAYTHRSAGPDQPFVKSYWQGWHAQRAATDGSTVAPSEAPFVVPERTPGEQQSDSYVHHGKAHKYMHESARVERIDSMEAPYAVFRFKYCSEEMLGQMLGRRGKMELEKEKQREQEEKCMRELGRLSKKELVKQLVERDRKEGSSSASKQRKAPSAASFKTMSIRDWVNDVATTASSAGQRNTTDSEAMTCDRCSVRLIGAWWHCSSCGDNDDGFDICLHCIRKARCNDDSHELIKWKDDVETGNCIKGPGPVNETLRGVQKGSRSQKRNKNQQSGGSRRGRGDVAAANTRFGFNAGAAGNADNTSGDAWNAGNAFATGAGDSGCAMWGTDNVAGTFRWGS